MKTLVRALRRRVRAFRQIVTKPSAMKLYKKATVMKLFDNEYYQEKYGRFSSPYAAFSDYLEKSSFANINPSKSFDTEYYLRTNLDVYHACTGALQHYLKQGEIEERSINDEISRWSPKGELHPEGSVNGWQEQKIAICLHIFYDDFIDKFAQCLVDFPANVDLFVAVKDDLMKKRAIKVFSKLSRVKNVKVVVAPNRGRNFGPLLVEFSKELLNYDLMCHVHSKKSLYSGREQSQWSNYLNQYLLKDVHVITTLLKLFKQNDELGIYYPTSFWMMPSWVNHWTCNRPFVNKYFRDWDITLNGDFLNYPVGGMFWARPAAVLQWLAKDYQYEDFPEEPLPADGSYLHAMERLVGLLAEKNSYKQFFYHPQSGKFTKDKSYIYINYAKSESSLNNDLSGADIVSFDVFDTLLRRKYFVPDYAKLKLGKVLSEKGVVSSPTDFIEMRNQAEHRVRLEKQFQSDVIIDEIYEELGKVFKWSEVEQEEYLQLEFEFDLDMCLAKNEMVNLANTLSHNGTEIWLITDTYYRQSHIEKMLKKIGLVSPCKLFVSSAMGMRKDNGTMWNHIRSLTKDNGKSYIHVGDNVRSDSQLCGDLGMMNVHILNPYDKWIAAGFDDVLSGPIDEKKTIKWGRLVCNFGRYPFFGE
ncbi:rhamnan synthesis F family protein [Aliikangiella sp. G2MR2-5]|uniref:rhamnan synthesis F family protein n=1 Tax=Aliikangiella sp. G2MR2-5 TaxID=2788943 RepID=UPI0018ABE84E|nr:rhamnan synthesis F family protein [Aliikangiella sp. G2MR2-5]